MMTSTDTGVLISAVLAIGFAAMAFIFALRALHRAQCGAEDMTDEVVMLFRDGFADRVRSRISEYSGPFWVGAREVLEVGPGPGNTSPDCEGLGKRQAQFVGQPWDVFLLLVAVISTAGALLYGGGLCCLQISVVGDMAPPDPSRLENRLDVGLVLLVLSVLSNVAHGAIKRQRALLAGTFATLLGRILTAAPAARNAPTASSPPGPPPPPPGDGVPGAG